MKSNINNTKTICFNSITNKEETHYFPKWITLGAVIGTQNHLTVIQIIKPKRTIDKIITKVDCKYGAPMGRCNVGTKPTNKTIFDCKVPMSDGCYDSKGAYWGIGVELRVSYTKDLTYIKFYRVGEK